MISPTQSRAVLLTEFAGPPSVKFVDIPQELEPGALLVRVAMASVCGTDTATWQGEAFTSREEMLPAVMGHEMVGTIVGFGPGARVDSLGQSVALGDRVLWTHAPCGHCFFCSVERQPTLCSNRRSYGRSRVSEFPYITGGFAEYCYVFPGAGRVRVPSAVKNEWAAPASCALRTVVHVLEGVGSIEAHSTVVVQGAGPLGLYATAMLRHLGVANIIVIGGPDARLELAQAYGATATVSVERLPEPAARVSAARSLTDAGIGGDVVLELSGAPTAFAEGLALLRPGGRYGVAGQTHASDVTVDPSLIVRKQLRITGTLSAHVGHYWKALTFLEATAGLVDWDAMIGKPYGLDDAEEAMLSMRAGAMKPLIDPWA